MPALVVTHHEAEGPGWIADWLVEEGLGVEVVEPWRGDALPASLEWYEALVVMGGPQVAYDDSSAPWLRAQAMQRRTSHTACAMPWTLFR